MYLQTSAFVRRGIKAFTISRLSRIYFMQANLRKWLPVEALKKTGPPVGGPVTKFVDSYATITSFRAFGGYIFSFFS